MRFGSTLRYGSWLIAASSVLLPGALLAFQLTQFKQSAEVHGGFVCDMPVLAMWLQALVSCAILSCLACILNGIHLFRDRRASATRYVELGLVANPAAAGVALILFAVGGP